MYVEVCRTHYPHWGAYSGINQFLKFINRERFSIGEQLVSDSDEDFPIKSRVVRRHLRDFVQIRGMKWYKLSDLTAEIKILGRCLKGVVDIVHYLDGEHSAQFLPVVLKRLGFRRPRFIATFHQPPDLMDSLLVNEVLLKLDAITVVSPDQIEYFRHRGTAQKVKFILHGVDTDYFSPRILPRSSKSFKCITVGHYLRDFKTIRAVARRLSKRPEIKFILVSACAKGLDDLPNIKVYSAIGDSELLGLYRDADVLFLPLIQATANNSLLEGIACGLPVISSNLTSVGAYLTGSEAILIMNNDPELLSNAIIYLSQNPRACSKMGEAARIRAEQLDWKKIVTQYEAVYSDLCV